MYCNVADPVCSLLLEKAVGIGALLTFVCEAEGDAELLKQELIIKKKLSSKFLYVV
jgi:hypothetical protein